MEDLVSQIDMPRLQQVNITFTNRVVFNTPRLYDFLPHPETLNAYNGAVMVFEEDAVYLKPNTSPLPHAGDLMHGVTSAASIDDPGL